MVVAPSKMTLLHKTGQQESEKAYMSNIRPLIESPLNTQWVGAAIAWIACDTVRVWRPRRLEPGFAR
jgi:hypothetical protein